ncbi:MAG: hypothetical protein GW870_03445 [Deltaproteobacteria bacterium]|nr:hypothetical protein [Deltaproteobacteria bacterium]
MRRRADPQAAEAMARGGCSTLPVVRIDQSPPAAAAAAAAARGGVYPRWRWRW